MWGGRRPTNSDWVSLEGLIEKTVAEPRELVFIRGTVYWKGIESLKNGEV